MTIGSTFDQSNIWYSDLCASHHVNANVENIKQCSSFEGLDQVIVVNGQGLLIKSIGSSSFISPYNHSADLVLNRILHVPTVSKNLLSVTKDNSIYFEFHPNVCFVKSQVSNEVLLKGHLGSNGLYTFPKLLSNSTSSSSIAKSTSKTDLLPSIVKSHFPVNSASINTV